MIKAVITLLQWYVWSFPDSIILTTVLFSFKEPGDLWYFPAGIPHSLQATGEDEGGSEFLLVRPYHRRRMPSLLTA